MHIIHKILFAITVWFVSLSVVMVFFVYGITNSNQIQNTFETSDYKTILQELNQNPLTEEELDYRYSLPYIILQSHQESLDSGDIQTVVEGNIENTTKWFQSETNNLKITLPLDTNSILEETIDNKSNEFITEHKESIKVCDNNQNLNIQENGYSASDFCVPSQVRSGQVSLTSYISSSESDILSNLIQDFDTNSNEIEPSKIEYMTGWVSVRNLLVLGQNTVPFLTISSIILASLLYYTQKNRGESITLEAINLIGYIAICSSLLSIIGLVLFNKSNVIAFVEQNSLPGITTTITNILGTSAYQVTTNSLLPALYTGIGLGLISTLGFIIHTRRIRKKSNTSEVLQIHEHDVFDQSVLLASLPDTKSNLEPNEKTLEIIEQIKNIHTKHNTENKGDLASVEYKSKKNSSDKSSAPSYKSLNNLEKKLAGQAVKQKTSDESQKETVSENYQKPKEMAIQKPATTVISFGSKSLSSQSKNKPLIEIKNQNKSNGSNALKF